MRNEYDFSSAKKNPYASKLKKQVTIRIDESAIDYFKSLAEETGISYQNLVNLYLVDCAKNKRKLEISFS
jgi:predicted DNA binding CopG/RHH family protein